MPRCIAFTATRSSNLPTGTNLLYFHNVTINGEEAFSLATNKFSPNFAGLYWIHFSIGRPSNTWANVSLLGGGEIPDIVREHTDLQAHQSLRHVIKLCY